MKFRKATAFSSGVAVLLLGTAVTAFAQKDLAQSNPKIETMSYEALEATDRESELRYLGVRAVADSEEFSEYQTYGLSYDSLLNHLMYDGEKVGYFKDEIADGVYTRILDDAGTVGIVVSRDSGHKILGLKKVGIPASANHAESGSSTRENSGSTDSGHRPEADASGAPAAQIEDAALESGDGGNTHTPYPDTEYRLERDKESAPGDDNSEADIP